MRMLLKICISFFLVISVIIFSGYQFWHKPKFSPARHTPHVKILEKSTEEFQKLKTKAIAIKQFASSRHYNDKIFFLVDMNLPSGKNRFFVYNADKDSIVLAGLVAHGSCDFGFQESPTFSNKNNSGCSSTGRYKIGIPYIGNFGLAYKLHGLDSSNNNAYARTIVLHSYECVPSQETYPLPICNSRGCPMTSIDFLQQLKIIINKSTRPVLLWIFE